jgi:hypothetical protein
MPLTILALRLQNSLMDEAAIVSSVDAWSKVVVVIVVATRRRTSLLLLLLKCLFK